MITTSGPAGTYRMSIAGCLESAIGAYGLPVATMRDAVAGAAAGVARLKRDLAAGRLPALAVARETSDIGPAASAIERLSTGAGTIVFFGTGGSALGGQLLAQFGGWNIPGSARPDQSGRPRTRFYDNLDAETLANAIRAFNLPATRFVLTSKSGGTPETLVQAIAVIQALRSAGLEARLPEMVLGLTEPADGGRASGLRALLSRFGIPLLDHHPGIGGRYSVLSNVGLLPALTRGVDVRALRAGAAAVLDLLDMAAPQDLAPAIGAALAVALERERRITIQVMMPYSDRLRQLGPWFGQLWAESLGKNGQGTMPVACLGPLDQHSQLQMLMDGPRAHLVSVVRLATSGQGVVIDADLARAAGLDMMAGRHVGDLIAAQTRGMPDALAQAGRPVRTFDVDRLDERSLGALLMHLMIETILTGWLLGVDPFDQPAVESAKIMTRQRLIAG